jgi:hypothetical protein
MTIRNNEIRNNAPVSRGEGAFYELLSLKRRVRAVLRRVAWPNPLVMYICLVHEKKMIKCLKFLMSCRVPAGMHRIKDPKAIKAPEPHTTAVLKST